MDEERSRLRTNAVHDEKAARAARRAQKKQERRQQEREMGVEPVEHEKSPITHLEQVWMEEFVRAFPGVPIARKWDLKQRGQVKQVLDLYDKDRVEEAIVFLIRNWKAIRSKVFKNQGNATPGVGVVLFLHENLIPNAATWAKHRATLEEYEAFAPGDVYTARPRELQRRYTEAMTELKSLGLTGAAT